MGGDPYPIPTARTRTETEVSRSRFIATVDQVETAEAARAFIASIRAEMPTASHHVYAFKVGFGGSLTEGVSDDGEPSGTAGAPVLAVLRGAPLGDVCLVVTRYFGGTKLGTGGLVRAYGDAARSVLAITPTTLKIPFQMLGLSFSYPFYERVKRLLGSYEAHIDEETFGGEVTLIVRFPAAHVAAFTNALRDLSAGAITPLDLS